MKYSVYDFYTRDEIERDWLISIFSDYHFEGFEETSDSLKAYIPSDKIRELLVREILYDNGFHHIRFSSAFVEEKNWNEEWEKNFEPVIIAEKVGIRAPFHSPLSTQFELIIEPKMSFGTGHHATTASVIELMLNEIFDGKQVLDFGSGTGVLSILAEKLGAQKITAIDNEEWAYNNCVENAQLNNCEKVIAILGDESHLFSETVDVILANINRNVILKNIGVWKKLMHSNSVLIVSGILQSDEVAILAEAKAKKLAPKTIKRKDGWLTIVFQNLQQN